MTLVRLLTNAASTNRYIGVARGLASASSSASASASVQKMNKGLIASRFSYPPPLAANGSILIDNFLASSVGPSNFIGSEGSCRTGLRQFSSQAPSPKNDDKKDAEDNIEEVVDDNSTRTRTDSKVTLLYKANPSRANFSRTLLATTTAHTGFWIWYVVDFLPALAAQNIATNGGDMDLTGGYLGLGLAIFMSVASCVYPGSLISEISRSDNQGRDNNTSSTLLVKTYQLPLITPSSTIKEYPLGDFIIDSSNDAIRIIKEHNGDIGKYHGHIAIHAEGSYTNYLMKMTGEDDREEKEEDVEVFDKELLLQSLTKSKQLVVGDTPAGNFKKELPQEKSTFTAENMNRMKKKKRSRR